MPEYTKFRIKTEDRDLLQTLSDARGYATMSAYLRNLLQRDWDDFRETFGDVAEEYLDVLPKKSVKGKLVPVQANAMVELLEEVNNE